MARNTRIAGITGVVCCLAALLFVALPVSAAKKEPQMKRVYMFGFAASLTDSTTYQTVVQTIDSAWIDPSHKFLLDRALYSLQLQAHVEAQENHKNTVCTIYFSTSARKLQRKWLKVRKRYERDLTLRYTILPLERFAFKAEEYRPVIISDEEVAASAQTPPVKPDGGKKSKKKKKK